MPLDLDPRQRAMLREMGLPAWRSAPTAPAAQSALARMPPQQPAAPAPAAGLDAPSPVLRPVPVDARQEHGGPGSADWASLSADVKACQACGLCAGRRATVFGPPAGPYQADWFVLGEPPDEDEERAGLPFVADQGRLLDNMLRSIGLERNGSGASGAWLSKVVKCRPGVPRNPEPAELAACQVHLQRELALVRPRVILAMGRFAAQALLQQGQSELATQPLGKLRGRVYRYQGLPLVVSYAPDSLLRTQSDKAKAWADLCLARQAHKISP